MNERLSGWFGPVTDNTGRRVPFRASRSALALCATALTCYSATILLGVLTLTDTIPEPWWAATLITGTAFSLAARTQLRKFTNRAMPR